MELPSILLYALVDIRVAVRLSSSNLLKLVDHHVVRWLYLRKLLVSVQKLLTLGRRLRGLLF